MNIVDLLKKNIVMVPVVASVIVGTFTGVRYIVSLTETINKNKAEITVINDTHLFNFKTYIARIQENQNHLLLNIEKNKGNTIVTNDKLKTLEEKNNKLLQDEPLTKTRPARDRILSQKRTQPSSDSRNAESESLNDGETSVIAGAFRNVLNRILRMFSRDHSNRLLSKKMLTKVISKSQIHDVSEHYSAIKTEAREYYNKSRKDFL